MSTTLDQTTVPVIRSRFAGDVLEEGDAGYDEARSLHNGLIDRRPRLAIRCAGAADVVAGVLLARETGLPLAIRSGGHGVNGHAVVEGGVLLDLSPMKRISVDPEARTVRAQAGATWGDLDAATQAHGLATTGGRITTTGIAGLTLGAGSGWLERLYGFTADNLLAATLVTADGRTVEASEDENPDLFWGLRGGGGNFGVVTEFTYRLHEVGPTVFGGMLLWPVEQAGEILRRYRDFMAGAPDEVTGAAALLTAPPAPFVPAELQGKHVVAVIPIAFTDPDRAAELWRPIRGLGPALDHVGPMPYVEVQKLLDPANPPGLLNYWKAELVPELTDGAIDAIVAHAPAMRSPLSALLLQPLGGAVARIPDDACAIGARDSGWVCHCLGIWGSPAETEHETAWVRAYGDAIEPFRRPGVLMTFSADTGEERVRGTFGDAKYARLVALKDRWDPDNLFASNQNIKPSAAT